MLLEFIALLGDLFRYTKYAIKTANGISDDTYSHSINSLVYWSGQGSTPSATGWEILVSKALYIHDNNQYGSHYCDLQGEHETVIGMLSHVGDNNISNNSSLYESIEKVVKHTQHDAQV